eukprot:162230-Lingulodinium_polyedra.AAC.1
MASATKCRHAEHQTSPALSASPDRQTTRTAALLQPQQRWSNWRASLALLRAALETPPARNLSEW